MKAIMMSIRPQWVAKILNGEKTIEIRKMFPKDYVGWVYIYATKGKDRLVWDIDGHICIDNEHYAYGDEELNGKVVARFWCDKVEEQPADRPIEWYVFKQGCLTSCDILNYCGYKTFYAIHITKVEIFDKPKEIRDFSAERKTEPGILCEYCNGDISCKECKELVQLTHAPQSWCYIEV